MGRTLELPKEAYLVSLIYWTRMRQMSTAKAAARLGISPHTAGKILADAYDAGLVETAYTGAGVSPEDQLSKRVTAHCEDAGVRETWVLPNYPFDQEDEFHTLKYTGFLRMQLGRLAAQYVAERCSLNDGDHLAIGGGRTMFSFAEWFRTDKRLVIRPLALGGKWRAMAHADAATVLQVILTRHTRVGTVRPEALRVICPEAPARNIDAVRSYPEVQALFGEHAPRPKVTVMSIGRVEYQRGSEASVGPGTSTYVRLLAESVAFERLRKDGGPTGEHVFAPLAKEDYEEAYRRLRVGEVVTDICRYGIRADGSVAENLPGGISLLDSTSLAIHPRRLLEWRDEKRHPRNATTNILVLGGSRLLESLKAALARRYFNVLIIDTALALALLPRRSWPRSYQAFADA